MEKKYHVSALLIVAVCCLVFCSVAVAAAPGTQEYRPTTPAALKQALEEEPAIFVGSTLNSKSICPANGMTMNINTNVKRRVFLYIGDLVNGLAENSLTLARGTTLMIPASDPTEKKDNANTLLINNGMHSSAVGTIRHSIDTLYLNGNIVVEDGGFLQVNSKNQDITTAGVTSGIGGVKIVNTGSIVLKKGAVLALPSDYPDTYSKQVDWSGSTGTIVFEEGARLVDEYITAKNTGLIFIDRGKRFLGTFNGTGEAALDSAKVQPADREASTNYITAGTYTYNAKVKAYVKGDPGDNGGGNDEDSGVVTPQTDPRIKVESTNPNVKLDSDVSSFNSDPGDLPSGHNYKGTQRLSIKHEGADDAEVTLTLPVPASFGLRKGMSNIYVFIMNKKTGTYSMFPVQIPEDNMVRYTVKPVGDYFSDEELYYAVMSDNKNDTQLSGGGSGGGGCTTGAMGLVFAALGVVFFNKKEK